MILLQHVLNAYNHEAYLQLLKILLVRLLFHLENSTLSAHVKPLLENSSSNVLISIGVVIKITVLFIYSQ